jgi:hypothetical protein
MTNVKRVQLDLPEKSQARLLHLKAVTEATSYAEVIKNALRLYEAIVLEVDAGNTFQVRTPDGSVKEYVIF